MRQNRILLVILFLFCHFILAAQTENNELISFDFVDQQIREILYIFSTYARISIIGDDTVTGTASFQYNGANFEQAFDSFLLVNRLFVDKTDEVWIVSRIKIGVSEEGLVLDSFDSTPAQLLDKLTRKTNTTILQDILPSSRLSLHLETNTPEEAVALIMRPFPDYAVQTGENFIQISKAQGDSFDSAFSPGPGLINIEGSSGVYTVEIERARLSDVLDRLSKLANKEYLSFIRADQMVERAIFSGKELHDTISIILEQGGGEYKEIEGLYYFFPRQQADIITELKDEGKSWKHFETRYLLTSEAMLLIQNRFSGVQIVSLSDRTTFLALVNDETSLQITEYLETIDIPRRSEAIRLKFIKTEDLYNSLPPSARREDLVDAGDGNTFFFLGTTERKNLFLKDLEIIDRPQPRIRYDLFIIQMQDSKNLNWSDSSELSVLKPGDRTMVTGQLGNLLNLNFDIITVFGYQFAAKLNSYIAENQAWVFADTTLFGMSGEEIKFQNTSTYRYQDSTIDPDTGRPTYSGITREIVSGLVLDITGWVSGDGMITTTLTASVSKRGNDAATTSGNIPPTSEKVLTTQVRARSGEAVVLSGLRQNDSTIIEQRVPFISKIPILGWLFKSKNNTTENAQMIIYLVPHVDLANDEYTVSGLKTASIFSRFVEPYVESK